MKTIITYGTFDLFHIGHLNILESLSHIGDKLIVGVSTDEFNLLKGKKSIHSFEERSRIIAALSCVDEVIPESGWDQKSSDIKKHGVTLFGMGADWKGKFDDLSSLCEVRYLPRTCNVSSTEIKRSLATMKKDDVQNIKIYLDALNTIVNSLE
jgi:glycerol-3-phosphate cytidylyltransferase